MLNKIRDIRRKNTSYDAYSYISDKCQLHTPLEIEQHTEILKNEMLYLEGYLTLEELMQRKVSITHKSNCNNGICCSKCHERLDYIIWNDLVRYSNNMYSYVKIPLSCKNPIAGFKRTRKELIENGSLPFRSTLLKEIKSEQVLNLVDEAFSLTSEGTPLGFTCPFCGEKVNYSFNQESSQ